MTDRQDSDVEVRRTGGVVSARPFTRKEEMIGGWEGGGGEGGGGEWWWWWDPGGGFINILRTNAGAIECTNQSKAMADKIGICIQTDRANQVKSKAEGERGGDGGEGGGGGGGGGGGHVINGGKM